MAETTGISWTSRTLLPESFAALQLADVADAVRFIVPQFVARMAERNSVADVVGQLRKVCNRLVVVCAKVATSIIAAVTTFVVVSRENRVTPSNVFRLASKTQMVLAPAMRIGVMTFSARSSLASNLTHTGASFSGVLFSDCGSFQSAFNSLSHG